jgi:hypothetical protein
MIVIDAPLPRYFLGDNRGYSSDPNASARINSLINLNNLDQQVPTLSPAPEGQNYCGESTEIDGTSGDVIETATADATGRVRFYNLRANQTVDPEGGVVDDSPSPNFVQIDYDAAANLPLLGGSPDIDMLGTLQIDRDAATVRFKGKVDGFPAFEAYVSFNGGPAVTMFQVAPIEPFELIGEPNRDVDVMVPVTL